MTNIEVADKDKFDQFNDLATALFYNKDVNYLKALIYEVNNVILMVLTNLSSNTFITAPSFHYPS